ncbi:MAG: hypothetical protein AB8G96_02385 [Phycisphaerales bacterium]
MRLRSCHTSPVPFSPPIAAALVAAGLMVPASVAHGEIIVDDFTSGDFVQTNSEDVIFSEQAGSMIGGFRFAGQRVRDNPLGLDLTTSVGDGAFSFLAGDELRGLALLGWGSGTVLGSELNLDLTGNTDIELRFTEALDVDVQFRIELFTSGVGNDRLSMAAPAGSTSVVIDLSSLDEVDLTDVDSLSVEFNFGSNAPTGLELSIDRVAFVPAPGAFMLIGMAGAAVGRRRRRA